MQIKRFVASSLAALMAGATFAGAALAATSVGGVLKTLGTQAAAGTPYLVVVGDTAAASDVVGAIDVASALAQQVTKEVAVPGVTVFDVEGKVWNDVILGTPISAGELTKTNIPYLIRDKFTFSGQDYYVTEKIVLPTGLKVNPDDVKFNGTLYLDSLNGLEYKYVFNTELNFTTLGVSYDRPLEIKILGNAYYLLSVDKTSITIMSGNVGIADATTPVEFGNYKVYVVDGASNDWAKIQIKDASGNVINTLIMTQGEEKDTGLGFKIKLLRVYTSTITNTATAKLLVGSELEKTISKDDEFVKDWKWDISISEYNDIKPGDYIGVKYQPENADNAYVKIGGKLVAPNGYFEVGYPKNVVDQFTKLEISLAGSTMVYPSITSTKGWNAQGGLLISADSPVFGGETYSKVLIYWNNTANKLLYAYYDDAAKKYVESATGDVTNIAGKYDNTRFKIGLDAWLISNSNKTNNLTIRRTIYRRNRCRLLL